MDIDQAYLGPHILTSAVLRLDNGVFAVVQRFMRGTLAANRIRRSSISATSGVGLGPDQPEGRRTLPPPP